MLGSMELIRRKSPPHKTAHEKPYKKPYKNPLAPNQHPLFLTYSRVPHSQTPSLIPHTSHLSTPLSLSLSLSLSLLSLYIYISTPPPSLLANIFQFSNSPILQFSNSLPPIFHTTIESLSSPFFSQKNERERNTKKLEEETRRLEGGKRVEKSSWIFFLRARFFFGGGGRLVMLYWFIVYV